MWTAALVFFGLSVGFCVALGLFVLGVVLMFQVVAGWFIRAL